jgi:hypothetical protein
MKLTHILSSAAVAAFITASAHAQVITQWTFEGDVITPATGTGTASLIGGTTSTFATGNSGGRGWNTTTYPAQSTSSGTAGVQFLVGTTGFENIALTFDHRASGTASRWAQVDYTLDGGITWTTAFWNNNGGLSPHDTFYSFSVDFTSVAGANNNANFGFRVVSIFSPLGFDQNASLADYLPNSAYMRANAQASYNLGAGSGTGDYGTTGTWRFDNVTISGTVIPEPSTYAAIAGVLALGLAFWHRHRKA